MSVENPTDKIGLLDATGHVTASDATATELRITAQLQPIFGNFLQLCDGVADEVQINAVITALP
jgi:hypothetical protein